MNGTLRIAFSLAGGLALFLFGMNGMSDSLQKAAGERMKKILSFLTKNPVMGALAGALVTAVLQSSSAATVMAIGFVSAGLMTLPEAISVIFGANIGTTMTAQIVAFKLSNFIYPILFAGFAMRMLSKREKIKDIGMVLFSFGLLFEGIETMSGATKPLASSPVFTRMMERVANIPPLGVLLGTAMTAIVQSSSATVAVLQNFASQPNAFGASVIGLPGAVAILLGDNIGTTVTALIASIGQSKDARRASAAHCIFNITGSAVFLAALHPLCSFARLISPRGNEVDVIARQIANAHTSFNVACAIVWIPLIPLMTKIVRAMIPGEDEKVSARMEASAPIAPKFLDARMIGQPAAAMALVEKEIARLVAITKLLIETLEQMFQAGGGAKDARERFDVFLKNERSLKTQIVDYVTRLFSRGVFTPEQSSEAAAMLFAVNGISRVADRCSEMRGEAARVKESGRKFSDEARDEICECVKAARKLFSKSTRAAFDPESDFSPKEIARDKENLRLLLRRRAKSHLARVEKKKCRPELTESYSSMLYALDRIADSCSSIVEETEEAFA